MRAALAIGGAALALHLALLPILAERARRAPLEVALDPAAADPRSGAAVIAPRSDRVEPPAAGELGPGLHNLRWQARYRGGFVETVAAAHRRGPRQSPGSPPCSVRVRIGQRLLDDGAGGPDTVAQILRPMLAAQLDGLSAWPLGDFQAIETLRLRWVDSRVETAADRSVLGVDIDRPPPGFLALELELRFSRGQVPLLVGLIPEPGPEGLAIRSFVRAEIDADSRIIAAILALLSGERRASEMASDEVAAALVDVLAPPPPLDLGGGKMLRLTWCPDNAITIAADRHAEIALAVELDHRRGDLWPPLYAPASAPAPETAPAVAVDIDANGLAALVHQLWASGVLDRALDDADLAGSFNRDPDVRRLLTLRVGALALAGPPSVAPLPGGFSVAAELAVELRDGGERTDARLFAAADVNLRGSRPVSRASLADLSLTCRPEPRRLRACYGLLVSELVGRSDRVTDWLETWLQATFDRLFVDRRVAIDDAPAALVLERAAARSPAPGLLRIALQTRLEN